MRVSLIVAASQNGVIGREGQLPWHLSSDLKRFKRLTTGHTIIMGRKTFESIGRPLPNRRSVVVTRDRAYRRDDVCVVHSLTEALESARSDEETFVIGGSDIFRQALPYADRIYLTVIHADLEGDATFPALDPRWWSLVESTPCAGADRDEYASTFQVWERTGRALHGTP